MTVDLQQEPAFNPDLTPQQMLELGVFGGAYFDGQVDEFPPHWFEGAKTSSRGFDVGLNYFGVAAGQSRDQWVAKGWITPEDPLGWFQWYCRYALGRRIPDVDRVQIARWRSFGARHQGAVRCNCDPGDIWCRPKQRQALLQWAYDPFF